MSIGFKEKLQMPLSENAYRLFLLLCGGEKSRNASEIVERDQADTLR